MRPTEGSLNLCSTFLRLRPDVSVEPLTVDAQFWQKIASGQLGSFRNEYLVTTQGCETDWPHWEMHPNGDEVVCLLSGACVFIFDVGTTERRVPMEGTGSFVIVPKGTWHTAKVAQPCRLLFITAGEGTQHRALAS
jgi:mannose-6-phosphate isomerase-like protein (cupin superfamily)